MAHVLSTQQAREQKSKGKVKSKVVHSSVPAISDIIIPIPPLAEQEKIANMIERFDHLCNDISNGLPAEIEARKNNMNTIVILYCRLTIRLVHILLK